MEITATAKNIRISPQKVRLLVGKVKKMTPIEAIQVLDYVPQRASLVLKKVIASSVANAKNNYGIPEDSLRFLEIQVGKGPMFKRYRAVARGRAHPILRRTSHIRVVLEGEKVKKPVVTQNTEEKTKSMEVDKGLESTTVAKEENKNAKV